MGKIVMVLAALFALSAPTAAADFTAALLDADGAAICQVTEKPCPPDGVLTLWVATRNALYTTFPDEQSLPGEEKFRRAELAQSLRAATDAKLTAEDVALVKRLVAKLYGPLVVHAAWLALDPAYASGGKR